MTSRKRTLLSIALFIPLAAILLTTFACLPAPVGDPDTAKVDASLIGGWQGVPKEGGREIVLLVRAWDAHTYFVQYLYSDTKDGAPDLHVLDYKGWLAEIAGTTFIVCETLDNKQFLNDHNDPDRTWWIAKLEKKGDTVTTTPIDEDSPLVKGVKTREAMEAAIKANIGDKKLYKDPTNFKKLNRDELSLVDEMRKRVNIGLSN